VDGGRRPSCSYSSLFPCQPCSICWQEQRGASDACPPGSSPDSLHGFPSPTPRAKGGKTLSLGSPDKELPYHDLPSTFASNMSSKSQRSKSSTVHAVYLPSDLPVGNLISLRACGRSRPSGNTPQIPRGCVAEWDAAGDGVRRQRWLPSQQAPRKPWCSCERDSGEAGALWLSGLLLSTLQGYCFGFSSIFPSPARCLREHAEESSGLFKMWKKHRKHLPCVNGNANLTHSSPSQETQAGAPVLCCAGG